MQPFNFLQSRLQERNLCREYLDRQVRQIVLLLAFSIVLFMASGHLKAYVRERAASVGSQASDMQLSVSHMRSRLKQTESSRARFEWMSGLSGGTRSRVDTIQELARCTPKDVWLSQVESTDNASTILVRGCAASYQSISAFTMALRSSPTFSEVNLGDVKAVRSANDETMIFHVRISIPSSEKDARTSTSGGGRRVPLLAEGA